MDEWPMMSCDCGAPAEWRVDIFRNGSKNVVCVCLICENDKVGGIQYHPKLGRDVEHLTVRKDYRDPDRECAHKDCTEFVVEKHHWAPRHLFADADRWPKAYLCPYHHRLWHEKISDHYNIRNTP